MSKNVKFLYWSPKAAVTKYGKLNGLKKDKFKKNMKKREIYFFTLLEAGSLKSSYWQPPTPTPRPLAKDPGQL